MGGEGEYKFVPSAQAGSLEEANIPTVLDGCCFGEWISLLSLPSWNLVAVVPG